MGVVHQRDVQQAAPVVVVTAQRGPSAELIAVIAPDGRAPSAVTCTEGHGGAVDMTIDWDTHSDRVRLDADRLDVGRSSC